MDAGNNMQQVWTALKDLEDKAAKLKAASQEDLNLKLQIHRSDADIEKRQEQQQIGRYINSQRNLLDAGFDIEQYDISNAIQATLRGLVVKAVQDLRTAFDEKMKQERVVLNEALSKFVEESDANIKKERGKVDLMIQKAWEQMDEGMENERSILKSLIQSLVEKEEVKDGIYIPRGSLEVLMDNECNLDVVMRFKVHTVKEHYPYMQKYYDSRESGIGQFTITKPKTVVEFIVMLETLRDFGYRGNAELYYLNPVPGSKPSTGLKIINGQEEVNELVLAHAEQRTKICHLYLVGPEYDWAEIEYYESDDDLVDMEDYAVEEEYAVEEKVDMSLADVEDYAVEEEKGDMSP